MNCSPLGGSSKALPEFESVPLTIASNRALRGRVGAWARRCVAVTIALAATCLHAAVARAQIVDDTSIPGVKIMEFNAGDLDDRTYAYAYVRGTTQPSLVFLPPDGMPASVYLKTASGAAGWLRLVSDKGWNSFAFDMVGGGKSLPPTTDELRHLVGKALYGVSQSGLATQPVAVFAPGISAAFAIKAKALDASAFPAAIFLDPIGPRDAQSRTNVTPTELVERRQHLKEYLWVQWGLGPQPFKQFKGTDLDRKAFEVAYSWYQKDQPQYWAAALTGFDSDLVVRDATHLAGWPVLILRSPGRTPEQIAREDQLAAWLKERGVQVERKSLEEFVGSPITELAMCGEQAPAAVAAVIDWATQFIPEGKTPDDVSSGGSR